MSSFEQEDLHHSEEGVVRTNNELAELVRSAWVLCRKIFVAHSDCNTGSLPSKLAKL